MEEVIEESSFKATDCHHQGGQGLEMNELSLGCDSQSIGEALKDVEFAGLGRLKQKDLLRVW